MERKKLIILINETISEFDFLSNDEDQKYLDYVKKIEDPVFQKQFIYDVINYKFPEKLKTSEELVHFEDNLDVDIKGMSIDLNVSVEYEYKDDVLKFDLTFTGDNVEYDYDEDVSPRIRDYEGHHTGWFTHINWDDINVTLFSDDGQEIKFTVFENVSDHVQNIFIRMFVQHVIQNESLEVKEKWNVPHI